MKKVLIILGGAIVILTVIAFSLSEESDPANDTEEEVEVEPDATGTSQDRPVPMGETARINGWELTVLGVTEDATAEILEHNQFNRPPEGGKQYFMASLQATFVGENEDGEPTQFWSNVLTHAAGENDASYSSVEDYCGIIPDPIEETPEIFTGETVTGNVCWPVASDQADSLTMLAKQAFSQRQKQTWFALRE